VGVCSLNHDTTTTYRLSHTPFPQKITPTCTRITAIRVYQYAHPHHLKVLKHFIYIQYGCGMHSMGVCSLNHDTATSYRLGHTLFSLKFTPTCTWPWQCNIIQARPYSSFSIIHPHLHVYYSIRMHPYAHPQHLKVLKHFVYPIWMWDAFNGCWQPLVKVFPWYKSQYRVSH